MKKLVVALILSVGLVLIPVPTTAQNTQNFDIKSFTADYYLGHDSFDVAMFKVEEKIVADFPDYDQNHGILRVLPETYQDHSLDLNVISVIDQNGGKRTYTTSRSNDNLVLRIGDPDRYIHGEQTYNITYTVRGVSTHYEDHDEIFWDVNGDQWSQPISEATARLHLPDEISSELKQEPRCFTGRFGSTEQDCQVTREDTDAETIITFTATELEPGENLSIVTGFNADTFEPYQRTNKDALIFYAIVFGGWILPPFITGMVALRNWLKYGRDPKGKGVIIPRYTPPQEVTVLDADALLNEKLTPKAISAQILDLAVRGYVKIHEIKEEKLLKDTVDYSLELINEPSDLSKFEKDVVTMFFGDNPKLNKSVTLSSLKNTLSEESSTLRKSVTRDLAKRNYFRHAPHLARMSYYIIGILFIIAGFVLARFIGGFIIAGVILLIVGRVMPARTKAGVTLREHLLGLRDYMQLAEADRIKTMQSPDGALTEKVDVKDKGQIVKVYERLLPYAMLFGIEKDWAKEFAAVYGQEPDWYSGASAFNGAVFASSLSSFSSTSQASFSSPSSSSSSGYGGGGFSGGGGGGGGGGGW